MRSRALDEPRVSAGRRSPDSAKAASGRRRGDATRRLLETIPLAQDCFRHDFPPLCQDGLRRATGLPVASAELDAVLAGLKRLDQQRPWWKAGAVALLARGGDAAQPVFRRAAVLLSLRPVARPDALLESISRSRNDRLTSNRLLALLNTDTTATLPMWHRLLARRCAELVPQPLTNPDPVLFLCFVKCLQHRLMDQNLFERSSPSAINAAHDNGRRARPPFFHPVLDYLGLTAAGYFRLMYNSLLNSLAFESPEAGWERIAWVRRFPGERYLLAALERLSHDPTNLAALQVAKWTHDLEQTRAAFGSRLGAFRPATLMLLSIVRRDMDSVVAAALGEPNHAAAVRWLRQGAFVAFRRAASDRGNPAAWCIRWGPAWEEALGCIGRLQPPGGEDSLGFARQWLVPDLRRLVENLAFVWAFTGAQPELLRGWVEAGLPSAILALALSRVPAEEIAALLHSVRQRATHPHAKAIDAALEHVSRQLAGKGRITGPAAPVRPVRDDAGLEGHQARVWPDIAGWTVKVSIAQGKPEVAAYGPKGRAELLPREVRQHPLFREVKETQSLLSRQHSQFRQVLEDAMVSQKEFGAEEFAALRENALFAEMSGRLVLECGGELSLGWTGTDLDRVSVAHPALLLRLSVLGEWQQRIQRSGVAQPFKQCFREVYVAGDDELQRRRCSRFSGHHILARSAFALLRARGWTPASGCAYKDWPGQGVRGRLVWADGVANVGRYILGPGRLEPVVTGPVYFRRLLADGTEVSDDVPIGEVDPVVFSEALRDADLLVARAAAGDMGRDSRAAQAFRATLLRQFAKEQGLRNIAVGADNTYAIVQGASGSYRVHLGSGSVFTEPEGRHVPAPPPAATPGRLPLEESDTRTARIVATVLSLAAGVG